jgi:hypothetical protein
MHGVGGVTAQPHTPFHSRVGFHRWISRLLTTASPISPLPVAMSNLYSPLSSPGCIRVVNIDLFERHDLPLICSLQEIDLINGTGYRAFSALSYRWGDGTKPQKITLDDKPVDVGQNLFDFLLHARESGWTRHIWIDALSINQDDLSEKNEQVAKMGEIYSLASSVLVWLGELDGDENFALKEVRDAMERVGHAWNGLPESSCRGCDEDLDLRHRQWKIRQLPEAYEERGRYQHYTSCLSKRAQRGLVKLLQNPYWRRKWIIQEAFLGGSNTCIVTSINDGMPVRIVPIARVVSVFLEQVRMDYGTVFAKARDQFYKAGLGYSTFRYPPADLSEEEREMWGLYSKALGARTDRPSCPFKTGVTEFWKTLSGAGVTYQPRRLMTLVDVYRDNICADRSDHVYALLGLSTLPTGRIRVDYRAGMDELFAVFSKAVEDDMAGHDRECIERALALTDWEIRALRRTVPKPLPPRGADVLIGH